MTPRAAVWHHKRHARILAQHPEVRRLFGADPLTGVAIVVLAAASFRHEHLLHHKHLGDADGLDTQAPTASEARLVGGGGWKKLLSFTLGRFFYKRRPGGKPPFDGWAIANAVAVVAADVALVLLFGWKPLVFLTAAALAGFGPHPVGARRISEHLTAIAGQPTNSYYGPWNVLSFDVGYHVEHHDFPAVAWRRLRELRATAPEAYDELFHVRSWTRLLVEYVTSSRYRVGHYVGREGPIAARVEDLRSSYGNDGELAAERSGPRPIAKSPAPRTSSPRAA